MWRVLAAVSGAAVEMEDLETGRRRLFDTGQAGARERYRREAVRHLGVTSAALSRAGCPHLVLLTGRPWLPPLMRYFAERRRGRRG